MDQFRRGSLTFDVRDSGPADGEPVVLLHGFPQSSRAWDAIVPALHEAGLRTLAPNQRGYSVGARPPRRRDYRSTEMVEDVVALLDEAGLESAHIVGHDWGAAVAWGMAGLHPERVRSLTALSVPHPGAFTRSFRNSTQLFKSWYMFAFQLPRLPEATMRRGDLAKTMRRMGMPGEIADHYAAEMKKPGALTGAINWYRGLPFETRGVPRSKVPTTYVWSNGDIALGRSGAEMCEKFVKGPYRFVEVDGNHWLPEEQPDAMATIILEQIQSAQARQDEAAEHAARN